MDLLEEIEEKDNELTTCYAIIQLQKETIEALSEKVSHLQKLLMHKAHIIDFNKE